jgi:flagellar export protein FliJ
MSWRESLIRISHYEAETLQRRLAEVVARRTDAELRLAMLEAEVLAECDHVRRHAETGWSGAGFMAGARIRRAAIQADIDAANAEEAGARDALAEAFESLKKFEMIAEAAKLAAARDAAKREAVVLDELGLRKKAG